MKLLAKSKVIIILHNEFNRIQNGRVIGFKQGMTLIEPIGKHFQSLMNNSKCFWIDSNSDNVTIILHRKFKDEQKRINQNS